MKKSIFSKIFSGYFLIILILSALIFIFSFKTNYYIATLAILIAIISLVGAAIFSRFLSEPIKELTDASRKVAQGNFDVRIFLKDKYELKELAHSFNYRLLQIAKERGLFFGQFIRYFPQLRIEETCHC